jgi:tetratricopeptide (TPR) repeat protein
MFRAAFQIFLLVLLTTLTPTVARTQPSELDRPEPLTPLRPETSEDRAHVEALELYARGLLRQENDQLIEATRLFEKARQLDPKAAAIHKILIPLYLALSRTDDALAACRTALELAPDDYTTRGVYARQLKHRGHLKEARDAFQQALKSPELADHLEVKVQMLFDLGVLCDELRDPNRAVEAFHEVVTTLDNPQVLLEAPGFTREMLTDQAAGVYERIIKICADQRQFDRAIRFFEEARAKYPRQTARLNFMIAKIYYDRSAWQKALEVLDAHLKTQPRGIEGYELRSAILKKLGREAEIVSSVERFAEQDSQNIRLQHFLASQYALYARPQDAERVYEKLLQQAPSPETYQSLFRLYRSQEAIWGAKKIVEQLDIAISKATKKENHAEEDFRHAARARDVVAAVRSDADLSAAVVPAARLWLQGEGQLHHQTLLFLGLLASRSRQLEEAELFFRRCLDGSELGSQEFAVYQGLIQVLWQAHKYKELESLCRSGLQKAQAANRILFYLHLSQVSLLLGKMEEAVAAANKAVDTAGDDRRLAARLNRVDILSRADRLQESAAEGEQLLKEFMQPGDVRDIRLRLANVYNAMRQYKKSEEQLQLVLKADPNDATANNDLGYQWADQGKNLDEAERLIRKAIDLDSQQRKVERLGNEGDNSDNAAFLDSLGWVLFRRGNVAGAREWLEKAAALAGGAEDPVVWDHLGDVYFRIDGSARARAAWQKSLLLYETGVRSKADEHYEALKRKLQKLQSAK